MASETPVTPEIPLLDLAEPPSLLATKAAAACRDCTFFIFEGTASTMGCWNGWRT